MAALLGHMNFWNASVQSAIDVFFEELKAPESRGMATIFGFIYSLLSLITVVGNALVIIAVYKDPLKILKNSPSNLILLSLSEADLIVGLMIGPGAAVWFFRIGKAAPSLGYIIVILSCSSLVVSVGNVLLLTIDRYYALATPLKYRVIITKKTVTIASSAIWVCSICYALTFSLLQQYFLLIWFVSVVLLFICSECICILYFVTLRNLSKHSRSRIVVSNSQSNTALAYQREKKVFKVILSVIFVFYLCFIPWLGNQFVIYFCKGCHSHRKTVMVCTYATQVFAILNSALNPVLYSCRFAKFQATFQYFLRKFLPHKGRKKSVRINERRQAYNTHL